jgi:hypothetical protein
MGLLVTIGSLCAASVVAVLTIGTAVFLATRRDAYSARLYLKRCALAGLPLLVAFLVLTFGYLGNPYGYPIWPDQDETAARRAARLAAIAFADRVWIASAILSTGGLLWFSRAAVVRAPQLRPPV